MSVLAPSAAGAALVGPGPGEVEAALPWEAAPMASLLAGEGNIAAEAKTALAPFAAVIAYTSSAALVRGLGRAGARVVARRPLPPPGGPHAGRWLSEIVADLGADPAVTPPVLAGTPEEHAHARVWLDRLGPHFLAIHPGSGSPRKNWPPDRFAAVVSVVAAGRPWLLVEGPADAEAAKPLADLPGAVHALEVPARVLGTILSRSGLYVGNDSGVSHLAAAFGAPVLALFGPTDSATWAPLGPRVSVLGSPDATMEGLNVAEVVRAALDRRSAIV